MKSDWTPTRLKKILSLGTMAGIIFGLTLLPSSLGSSAVAQNAELSNLETVTETQTVEFNEMVVNSGDNQVGPPPEGASSPRATLSGPIEIPADASEFTLSGTNWLRPDNQPSSFMVQYNAGGIKPLVEAPNNSPNQDFDNTRGRSWTLEEANEGGVFEYNLPVPTVENSDLEADLQPGEEFRVQVLGGMINNSGTGDWVRNPEITIKIGDPLNPDPTDPGEVIEGPDWPHHVVKVGNATAFVESGVEAGSGQSIRVQGYNWVNSSNGKGSIIALKLNGAYQSEQKNFSQYGRSGDDVIEHPSASGDNTIWALLAPENPENHPNIFPVDDEGNFDIVIDAPAELTAGEHLSILFQSGRFDNDEGNSRAITSDPITIGGVEWEDPRGEQEFIICTSEVPTPTLTMDTSFVELGGVITLSGEGWCHPTEGSGASAIAFKIDEGAISRPDTSLHDNDTIWHIVWNDSPEMDQTTGNWSTQIQLPDGTENTSVPALAECRHSFRLLTGSLVQGDMVRSVRSENFVVGIDQPCGTPEPVEANEDLTPASRGGVTAVQEGDDLVITVPEGRKDDWVYIMDFAPDGSPLYSFGDTWLQLNSRGQVTTSLDQLVMLNGTLKIAVQSGNEGEEGELIGWDDFTFVEAEPEPTPKPTPSTSQSPKPSPTASKPAPNKTLNQSSGEQPSSATSVHTTSNRGPIYTAPQNNVMNSVATPLVNAVDTSNLLVDPPPVADIGPAPTHTPELLDEDDFDDDNAGEIGARLEAGLLILTLPEGISDWVHVALYPDELPLGWIAQDGLGEIRIDTSTLPDGEYKFALQDSADELVGWVQLLMGEDEDVATAETSDAAPEASDVTQPQVQETAEPDPIVGPVDWILMTLGTGIFGGTAASALLMRPRLNK